MAAGFPPESHLLVPVHFEGDKPEFEHVVDNLFDCV